MALERDSEVGGRGQTTARTEAEARGWDCLLPAVQGCRVPQKPRGGHSDLNEDERQDSRRLWVQSQPFPELQEREGGGPGQGGRRGLRDERGSGWRGRTWACSAPEGVAVPCVGWAEGDASL